MNSKGNKHLGPVRDEEERRRRMDKGGLSTPSLPLADKDLDIRMPSPDAPMDDDLRPRTHQPGSRD